MCMSTGVAWMDGRSRDGQLRAAGTGGKRYKQGWADEEAGRRASRRPKSSQKARFWLVLFKLFTFTHHKNINSANIIVPHLFN